ncbi:phage portal protein, partial [Enterobacter cloacae]
TKEGAAFKVIFEVVTDEGTLEIEEVIGEDV